MSVSASLVKELREKTSAGMMDCKKALEETQGDFEAAIEWLRKKGLSSAAKKSGRIAAEGAVFAMSNETAAVVVEVNSETDFVARNDGFKVFVNDVAEHCLSVTDGDPLAQPFKKTGKSVEDSLREVIATLGENIVIRRSQKFDLQGEGVLRTYVHGEGKIGVLVEILGSKSAEVSQLAQDLCLHIAAINPMAISAEQIPADVVNKEREILKAKNIEQGKKADMVDKIVEGQIKKFLAESCLMDQPFVKNPDLKVSEHVKETAKKLACDLKVSRFARFELGEGIEKKVNDFAAEVAAQVKGH